MTLDIPKADSNSDSDKYTKQSPLWPYCGKSLAIWRYPSDKSTAINTQGQKVPRIRSYSMNCWMGGPGYTKPSWPNDFDLGVQKGWQVFRKLSAIGAPNPSMSMVLIDERPEIINDGWFGISMYGYPDIPSVWTMYDWPAKYPNNASGISFADGHADIHRWKDARTQPTKTHYGGETMPNNQDIFWVMDHCTGKSGP